MSRIPAHPTLAAALLASANHACTADLLTLTAILSSEEIFVHPRQEHKRIEAETSHAHFGHPSGDHVALLRVYDAWINARESDTWCQKHYIRSRSLRIVKTARAQLEEILRGFGIDTSTTRRHASHRNRRHRRRDSISSDSDPLADYDASPILQSLSAGLFTNTAKRHPHRPHFYHYLSSTAAHPSSGNSLLCLYTSPNSTLAGPAANGGGAGISDGTRGDVEWVLYQDVQFVTRANMRVVSSVQFEWVKEGLARVASCDVNRLIGVMKEPAGKRKRELEGSEGPESRKNSLQAEKEERREEVEEGVVEREKLEREAKAAAAKLRYLSRKKK
ncbi:hypothetical protein BC830DRAFT_143388 [Chytriomyces sp. MP71]|nr:hypothetical protein BC830DRAFT_143388 [Chytriomyces sp. MP71]